MKSYIINHDGPFEYQTFVDLDGRRMVTTISRKGQNFSHTHTSDIPIEAFVFDEFYARHMRDVYSGNINQYDGC